jgi:hypothetical protein
MKQPLPENLSEVMAALGRRRTAKLSKEGRQELAAMGGRASWAGMGPNERVVEMKRRARIRMRNRARKVLSKVTAVSR